MRNKAHLKVYVSSKERKEEHIVQRDMEIVQRDIQKDVFKTSPPPSCSLPLEPTNIMAEPIEPDCQTRLFRKVTFC